MAIGRVRAHMESDSDSIDEDQLHDCYLCEDDEKESYRHLLQDCKNVKELRELIEAEARQWRGDNSFQLTTSTFIWGDEDSQPLTMMVHHAKHVMMRHVVDNYNRKRRGVGCDVMWKECKGLMEESVRRHWQILREQGKECEALYQVSTLR